MTGVELHKKYKDICNNLQKRRLKPAFDQLAKLISDNGLGVYYDEYRNLEETYHFMLKYTLEGTQDPERQKVYRKLIVSVFELTDKINEALQLRFSPSVEYEKKRLFKDEFIPDLNRFVSNLEDFYLQDESSDDEAKMLSAAKEHQKQIRKLFYHVWFSDKLSPDETDGLRTFFTSPVVLIAYKSLVISALTLSLRRYFDSEKFTLLFEAFDFDEPEISQRALVGVLVNLYHYDARLSFFPEITGRLKILNENPEFKRNIERVIIQFIRSKETEKLQQRIRDEILPEMIKISPNLKDKINLDSLMEEGLSEDKNPDWQEIFKDSPGLMDKMQEFSELQMEGADVFMGSFAMLKAFPFFSEIDNWFVPFFTENPEIANTLDFSDDTARRLMEALNKAPVLCNSDKYSFCLSIQGLPKENREFMAQGINAEMDQLKELEKDEELTQPGREAEFISNQYIQDLYRFYKLFPRKNDFEDIFSWHFDFHNKLAFGEILREDHKLLRNIGEYYFAKNHFDEAAEIFGLLLEQEKDGELYQKIAYCYQKTGNFEKALDGYLKAELYDINRLWNLKKIALCYRNLKQPAKALEYYQAAEKIDSENLNNQLNIGHCLLELSEYDEALKCYFKVEYLSPGNKKVWRPIAWCSFLTGKKEQAAKYFSRLIDDEPSKHDYMNMGHVQWSLGNRKAALDFYRKSISENGFSADEFQEVFEEDLPHLISQGIDAEDVPIMLDQLRYFLES
ncbi:Tetratricopeptide repeat-containing protein [Mariniphaga anaerophila]|uniref:Tetratricopeptide repeat-containing protein n=1 Tax=Mariniphaga anaerophila TaxID=1484053 RepID=A0A1M4THX5_9BACT|nr:tetratricopeptide repeat protein [Mariniphaga anaerophila]SHE44005.1 Tetratricopeptide repeat-containing protein [Mariniphaga anaerophila]